MRPLQLLGPSVSHWCEVNGLRIHARLGGWNRKADTVVLVHGIGVSSRYMMPMLNALATHVRVAAPDLPGFGRSDKPEHALTIEQLADALIAWMDAMGLEAPTLVGNSMGCQIIVDLAVRFPSRIARGVLIGPTLEPGIRKPLPALWRLGIDAFREAPSLPFLAAYDYLVFGPRRLWRTFGHAVADPLESKLSLVHAPTLVVRGTRDPIAPQWWVESITRRMPNAQLIAIPGAAHAANYMCPDAVARSVLTFMAKC